MEKAAENAIRKVLRERPAPSSTVRRWASTAQLAAEYSIARSTIRQWVHQGKVRSILVGSARRISVEDFERMVSGSTAIAPRAISPEELADRDDGLEPRSRRG